MPHLPTSRCPEAPEPPGPSFRYFTFFAEKPLVYAPAKGLSDCTPSITLPRNSSESCPLHPGFIRAAVDDSDLAFLRRCGEIERRKINESSRLIGLTRRRRTRRPELPSTPCWGLSAVGIRPKTVYLSHRPAGRVSYADQTTCSPILSQCIIFED
jgi:hypothetical protein